MPHLELVHLSKVFGPTRAVTDLNLHVERGEILSILGPSGCGKTTTLRMIAGLETPASGSILSNGRDITALPARARNMGLVFQNYALFPHLDVFENIAFGMKTRRLDSATIEQRVSKTLANVRMQGYERRSVHQLSGGQQQRIALARALAIEPEVLLLDEPLSNLDPSLREDLRDQIRNIIRELSVTTVFVTHDQQEAFALAGRIAIMEGGVCRQVGKPEDVYNRPADAFVAQFLGKANLLPGRFVGLGDDVVVVIRSEDITVGALYERPGGPRSASGIARSPKTRSASAIARSPKNRPPLQGRVAKCVFEGAILAYTIEIEDVVLTARQFHHGQSAFRTGESVLVSFPNGDLHAIVKP